MHKPLVHNNKRALSWLCATLFVLLSIPRLNVRIGPIPFYVIDLMILTTFVYALRLPKFRASGNNVFVRLINILLFLVIFSEVFGAVVNANYFDALYIITRLFLAFSLFYSIRRIVLNFQDLKRILQFAFFGICITGLMLILTSIPQTRDFTTDYLLTLKFLEPAGDEIIAYNSKYSGALRGNSYVGVSILSAAFINGIWPFLLLLRKLNISKLWKSLIFVSSIVLPASVIFTYSRGAIIGLGLTVLGVLIFNPGNYRVRFLISALVGILIFLSIGLDSNVFYFRRLEQSTQRVVENPIEDRNETERLYSYIEPFWHLKDNPNFLLFGEGSLVEKAIAKNAVITGNRADHSVFGKTYYMYGMLAALLYNLLIVYGIVFTLNNAILQRRAEIYSLSRVLFASILGLIPWFIFGHAAISTPRGIMFTMVIFGFISIQTMIWNKKDGLEGQNRK